MVTVHKIEKQMEGAFKDLPHLPESSRESLAKVWPWLALIFGAVQLFAAWGLWNLTRTVNALNDFANSLSVYYAGRSVAPTSGEKTVIYLGIALLAVDAVILLMAYPHLKTRARRGWDLIFLGSLINLLYGIVQIFTYDRGFGDFILSLVGSAVGFYLLFEVRSKYGKKSAATHSPAAKK